jgi:c-di-GMP-binding flagellar brake protein YcgR
MLWSEKRKHPRVRPSPQHPIRVQIVGGGFIESVKARDISAGGVGLVVPHNLDGCNLESELELIISLPSERFFRVTGRVQFNDMKGSGGGYLGIQFVKISPADTARISKYVEGRLADGGGAP